MESNEDSAPSSPEGPLVVPGVEPQYAQIQISESFVSAQINDPLDNAAHGAPTDIQNESQYTSCMESAQQKSKKYVFNNPRSRKRKMFENPAERFVGHHTPMILSRAPDPVTKIVKEIRRHCRECRKRINTLCFQCNVGICFRDGTDKLSCWERWHNPELVTAAAATAQSSSSSSAVALPVMHALLPMGLPGGDATSVPSLLPEGMTADHSDGSFYSSPLGASASTLEFMSGPAPAVGGHEASSPATALPLKSEGGLSFVVSSRTNPHEGLIVSVATAGVGLDGGGTAPPVPGGGSGSGNGVAPGTTGDVGVSV